MNKKFLFLVFCLCFFSVTAFAKIQYAFDPSKNCYIVRTYDMRGDFPSIWLSYFTKFIDTEKNIEKYIISMDRSAERPINPISDEAYVSVDGVNYSLEKNYGNNYLISRTSSKRFYTAFCEFILPEDVISAIKKSPNDNFVVSIFIGGKENKFKYKAKLCDDLKKIISLNSSDIDVIVKQNLSKSEKLLKEYNYRRENENQQK